MKATFSINANINDRKVKKAVQMALFDSMLKMHELAVRRVPVDTGRLKNSIKLRPMTPGRSSYQLIVGAEYGADVEYGTSPHMPPSDALRGWSKRVLKNEDAAFAVAKKIAREGTPAQPFLRPALKEVKDRWVEIFVRKRLQNNNI